MQVSIERVYDGREQVVFRDGDLEAHVAPDKGARIVQIKKDDLEVLHRVYPGYVEFGPYLEYGGVEYLLGSAPGSVYDRKFDFDVSEESARFWCFSKDVLFEKTLRIREPFLEASYSFVNLGERFVRFTFSIHPEITMGDHRECIFKTMTQSGEERATYQGPGNKRFFRPTGRFLSLENPKLGLSFVVAFPQGVVDRIELYYPQVDTHVCPQLMLDSVGLNPRTKATYRAAFGTMGAGDVEDNLAACAVDEATTYTSV